MKKQLLKKQLMNLLEKYCLKRDCIWFLEIKPSGDTFFNRPALPLQMTEEQKKELRYFFNKKFS